mgnify:CR=1 FL=1
MLIDDTLCAVLRGESIDWPDAADEAFYIDLLARAAHHGVGSLLCHTLKSSNAWKQVPDRLQKPLLLQLRNGVAFEMLRAKDLVELNKSFELAGIPMLVLKGAALAYSHYAEPYLRARGDTDIFIRLEDIRKSRAVFSQSGYELRGPVYKSHQPTDRFHISDEVLSQEVSGETVLLDLQGECFFSLNEVGTRIWQLLKGEHAFGEIIDTLVAEFDVEQGELKTDLDRLLNGLLEAGLLQLKA